MSLLRTSTNRSKFSNYWFAHEKTPVTSEGVLGAPTWGQPGECPSCSTPAIIDILDPCRGIMHMHCPSCGSLWDVHRDE